MTTEDDFTMPCAKYIWGRYKDYDFEKEAVFWKKNLFLLPSGKAGIKFIDEDSRLMTEWLQYSPLKDIVFKAIIEMLNLLFQKLSQKSQSKDHLSASEREM